MHKDKIVKIIALLIFSAYMMLLLRLTVFRDNFLEHALFTHGSLSVVPLAVYLKLFRAHKYLFMLYQFGGNIAWFVPFGLLLPYLTGRPKKLGQMLLLGLLLSFIIELSQFAFGTGVTEIDDLILNTLGAMIGFLLFRLYQRIREKGKT